MKWRKVVAAMLVGAMTLTMTACGDSSTSDSAADTATDSSADESAADTADSTDTAIGEGDKLVVWTLANDLIDFGERFKEERFV